MIFNPNYCNNCNHTWYEQVVCPRCHESNFVSSGARVFKEDLKELESRLNKLYHKLKELDDGQLADVKDDLHVIITQTEGLLKALTKGE